VSSVGVEEALLVLKVAFLVLLYLFIWRIVRSATRDLQLPQESLILAPHALGGERRVEPGSLVVVNSTALEVGFRQQLDSSPLTVGRGSQNDIQLDSDDFASARHARFTPGRDGVFVEDAGSTNGTYVNGARVAGPRRLAPGDVVRVGQTDFRYER
jgi:pSer/pThr/pTyr-binding forkhead associated (FHA) protein